MDYVLEFDEFVRSIKQNMDTKFSMFLGAGASVESGIPSISMQRMLTFLILSCL